MTTFKKDVLAILHDKNYGKHCHALEALVNTVEINCKFSENKVRFYKWSGLILLTSIPIISALVSIFVGQKGKYPSWLPDNILFWLSLTLTFFTIVNSIFRPSQRFTEACRIGIGIERFVAEFLVELERMSKVDESTLLELIDKKGKEFEIYQRKLIDMFMPIEVDPKQVNVTGTKKVRGGDHS